MRGDLTLVQCLLPKKHQPGSQSSTISCHPTRHLSILAERRWRIHQHDDNREISNYSRLSPNRNIHCWPSRSFHSTTQLIRCIFSGIGMGDRLLHQTWTRLANQISFATRAAPPWRRRMFSKSSGSWLCASGLVQIEEQREKGDVKNRFSRAGIAKKTPDQISTISTKNGLDQWCYGSVVLWIQILANEQEAARAGLKDGIAVTIAAQD